MKMFTTSTFKRINSLLLALVLISVVKAADITSGLILHYTFDDFAASVVTDASGNNHNADKMGTDSIIDGFSGQALFFKDKAQHLVLPDDLNAGLESFTYAAWVNLNSLTKDNRFFDFGSGVDGNSTYLVFIPSAGTTNGFMRLRYRAAGGSPAGNVDVTTSKIPTGTWAHIALTMSWNAGTSTSDVKIYINGTQVANNAAYAFNPAMIGATTENYIGQSRWAQDGSGLDGALDDIRMYNRALTADDILALSGLAELNKQYEDLNLGDISGVSSNLTLPTTLGSNGVQVEWSTSNATVIDSLGTVTQPEIYDEIVTLTAKLTLTVGTNTYTLTKSFDVKVLGLVGTPELIAQWNFGAENISLENDTLKIMDVSGSNFQAHLVNEASIRTIGESTQFNVLDLGQGQGYMDLGTEIGKAIYHLGDFAMMGYFYIDPSYAYLNSNGNYFWNFSNSQDVGTAKDGFMYGRLNGNLAAGISAAASPSTPAASGLSTPTGEWHHIAFVQSGKTGTVYLDGIQVAQNTSMPSPATALKKDSLEGTRFNWLGRSCWPGDQYLQNALLYDYQIYSIPLTADNLLFDFGVTDMISQLNAAYIENPNFKAAELETEFNNLNLGDLSALTSDITLPSQGSTDPTVDILWKSSCETYLSSNGKVTRPNYADFGVTLTATLKKGIQSVSKSFEATVKMVPGTGFNSDLLVKYDFSNVSGNKVTDMGEKKLEGTLMNDASIRLIGTQESGQYNVLDLGDSIGYFDMGLEVGKVLYGTTDYSMNAYFRIDTAYQNLGAAGNFLWSFANSTDAMKDQNGYIIGTLNTIGMSISPKYYTYASGNRAVNYGLQAEKGGWHSFTYTQEGSIGSVYVDGLLVSQADTIIYNPSSALKKPGFTGTPYNWLGRSCYSTDAYLRNTLVYDFRMYNRALSDIEILALELNVGEVILNLNTAYEASPNANVGVKNPKTSNYKLYSANGTLYINGKSGEERVDIFDISGRLISSSKNTQHKLSTGIYLVRIQNTISKVAVK